MNADTRKLTFAELLTVVDDYAHENADSIVDYGLTHGEFCAHLIWTITRLFMNHTLELRQPPAIVALASQRLGFGAAYCGQLSRSGYWTIVCWADYWAAYGD